MSSHSKAFVFTFQNSDKIHEIQDITGLTYTTFHRELDIMKFIFFIGLLLLNNNIVAQKYENIGCIQTYTVTIKLTDSLYFLEGYKSGVGIGKVYKKNKDTLIFTTLTPEEYNNLNFIELKKEYKKTYFFRDTFVVKNKYEIGILKNKYLYLKNKKSIYSKTFFLREFYLNIYYALFPIDIGSNQCDKLSKKRNKIINKLFNHH